MKPARDDTVLVCQTVASQPEPKVESEQWDCGICGNPIWVAKSSPRAQHYWCMKCVAEEIEEDGKPPRVGEVTPEQLADLAAYFNRNH